MRGLLEKDFRLTLTRKQTLLIFVVMALFMGMSMDGTFLVSYLTMLAAIIAIGTLSYDEIDNGFLFLMTLPFDRKIYVREKYLFCLLMAAAAWCVGAVLYFATGVIHHDPVHLADDLPMLLSIIPVLYLSTTILIPLQLKYGPEKSRVALFLIFGIIAVLLFGTKTVFNGTENPLRGLAKTLDRQPPLLVLFTIVIACALLSFLSYTISVRIMENKEF